LRLAALRIVAIAGYDSSSRSLSATNFNALYRPFNGGVWDYLYLPETAWLPRKFMQADSAGEQGFDYTYFGVNDQYRHLN